MGKIDPKIIRQIPELFKELGKKSAVAKRLGISTTTVSKYLNLYEAGSDIFNEPTPPAPLEREGRKLTQESIDKINKRYSECINASQVGREFGIRAATVTKYLTEENKKLKEMMLDDRDVLWFYIVRLFGKCDEDNIVSNHNLNLMQKFYQKGMPYRGQYLTLKYYYEVQHHKVRQDYLTIGLIPYIYDEALRYWKGRAKHQDEITEAIKRQLEKDRVEIKYNPREYINKRGRGKKKIDISTIGEE